MNELRNIFMSRNLTKTTPFKVWWFLDIKIIELNVQPEHMHCVVGIKLSMRATYALQILKGGSARLFFQFHERARLRYPKGHLWSPGKFAASLGFIQVETAKSYVRNQEEHHTGSLAL